MSFYQQLQAATRTDRQHVLQAPLVTAALAGHLSQDSYLAFLSQAYHHVKHTVPLLMACGSRLDDRHAWLRDAVAEYIAEEIGHEIWILNDTTAAGGNAETVRNSAPAIETELMVSYAYDLIARVNPIGFFGMVQVLEGTSVAVATAAARAIQSGLGLPDAAFSYLLSHGDLDQDHVRFFQGLMDRVDSACDRAQIIHAARVFYRLYGAIFRALPVQPSPA